MLMCLLDKLRVERFHSQDLWIQTKKGTDRYYCPLERYGH